MDVLENRRRKAAIFFSGSPAASFSALFLPGFKPAAGKQADFSNPPS
jgi:hypothetical protein